MTGKPRASLLLLGSGDRIAALRDALEAEGFAVETGEEPAASALAGADLALLDLGSEEEAARAVRRCRKMEPLVSVVVLSPVKPEGSLLLTLGRAGAYDCLHLPDPSGVAAVLPRLEAGLARGEHRRRPHPVGEKLLGGSDKVSQVRRYIQRAADSNVNVLLLGETGTGKELAARAIHDASPRKAGPFLAVNCAAIPETLLESELFGHERGSFTGADRMRRGAFEMADGGTLFLDEVGEMPPAFQAKLLRVLQPPPEAAPTVREFFRVGGERPLCSDARVISATNTDLFDGVAKGRFREDLMERIQVIAVHLPPLRDRREDVPELVAHFLKRHCRQEDRSPLRIDASVLGVLQAFDFPRNVRELEGAIRSIVTMKEAGDTIVLGDLPLKFFETGEEESPREASPLVSLAEMERVHVERVLAATGGNKSRAARILGISRPTLDRKIRRHGIGGTPCVTPR